MSEPCQGCRCGCSPSDGDPQAAYDFTCEHCGCGPDMPWPPVPAAAVPEAQDGRRVKWARLLEASLAAHHLTGLSDACIALSDEEADRAYRDGYRTGKMHATSAAVREGERERLLGLADEIEQRGDGWRRVPPHPNSPAGEKHYAARAAYETAARMVRDAAAVLPAAPSLAAPEGTEQ